MTKKEYVEKMANLIRCRVLFHAPKLESLDINYQLLDALGISKNLPIFRFDKPLTKPLYKAFLLAQKSVDFNLILTGEVKVSQKKLAKLKNSKIITEDDAGAMLREAINTLNINYYSQASFCEEVKKSTLKICDKDIKLEYRAYFLYAKGMEQGVIYSVKEFLLNGKNFVVTFQNPMYEAKDVSFELNIPLPHGYYSFKKKKFGVEIESLYSRKKNYFNYLPCGEICFSAISGLESSTHACINLRIKVHLKSKQQSKYYFNFGDKEYFFTSPHLVEDFFAISQDKTRQLFDVLLHTRDKEKDERFNKILPQKIWLGWENGTIDEESESEYLQVKNSLVKKCDGGIAISPDFKGLKVVELYQNGKFKKVYIVDSPEAYILADKTRYCNYSLISSTLFQKNNEIYLSFGS